MTEISKASFDHLNNLYSKELKLTFQMNRELNAFALRVRDLNTIIDNLKKELGLAKKYFEKIKDETVDEDEAHATACFALRSIKFETSSNQNVSVQKTVKEPVIVENRTEIRKRGRPPGSKNKPKT